MSVVAVSLKKKKNAKEASATADTAGSNAPEHKSKDKLPAAEERDLDRTQGMLDNTNDFFFSSRRRHTRLTCDSSSDVCSSDLPLRHRDRLRAVREDLGRDRLPDGRAR